MATKPYKIRYLPASQADLLGIFEYISPLNMSAANHLLDAFDNEISKLGSMPRLGKVIDDYELMSKGYRVLIVEKHYVFYVIEEDNLSVKVHRILSSRQEYLQWLTTAIIED
ncbi:MAG: addiction module toxin, RelE/StbE family [Firmicutes bacterium]|nr:addiction module toxin, RelE/StbE family [Bacillota bacterium]